MASTVAATLVAVVVLCMAYKAVAEYPYYYGGSKNTLSEIKKYDTLEKDTNNLLKKYTNAKAAGCKTSLKKQKFYTDATKTIADKLTAVTKSIQDNDKVIEKDAKKCGNNPNNNACVQRATNKGSKVLNNIKKPAISLIKDTKTKANKDIKTYMGTCTK